MMDSLTGGGSLDFKESSSSSTGRMSTSLDSSGWTVATGKASATASALPAWVWVALAGVGVVALGVMAYAVRGK